MKNAKANFQSVIHELARTYQAFEQFSSQHVRQLGLTPPQFDVVATLGNGKGMNCKELSDRTLITKGTLTGVIDRLEDKGLVTRSMQPHDRRSVFISLTPQGKQLYDEAFPAHMDHMQIAFKRFGENDLSSFCQELGKLRASFNSALETREEALA